MTVPQPDTDLLRRAGQGDPAARDELLRRYRPRLRQLVALRLDPRLAARIDPSDVVQETLAEASGKLAAYLRQQPLPFYPWLRQLAWRESSGFTASTSGPASGASCASSARSGRCPMSQPWN